jgi:precorrin-2 dehydrogenase / sirohydrochlorin ferrochelatase
MYYPLFLNLTGEKAVVIGAGRVAERKIRSLLKAGAEVTMISPDATAVLRRFARTRKVRWLQRCYRAGDLRGARLVIAATDDETVNQHVCAEAKRRRLLVNCAASPDAGNFIVPSVVRRGNLTVAISTGGASPALAKLLRRELEQTLSGRYAEAAAKMIKLRNIVSSRVTSAAKRKAIYRRAVKQLLRRSD